jgi:uncharacterized protein (DUF2252 family)
MPSNNAERVVAGANALSPFLGERMVAAHVVKRQVVVRELRPQDLKFELERLQQAEAIAIARLMAGVEGAPMDDNLHCRRGEPGFGV